MAGLSGSVALERGDRVSVIEALADAVEGGARDQQVDDQAHEQATQFRRAEQILNSFGSSTTEKGGGTMAGGRENPSYWLPFNFYSTSIQTILLVVFVDVFRDEYAHVRLQAWIMGTGIGRLLLATYKRFREQSDRLPQAVSVCPGSEVGESQPGRRQRFGKILFQWLWISLDVFFALWIGVGIGIVYVSWMTGQTPHLSWLCTIILAITSFLFILVLTVDIGMLVYFGVRVLLRVWPRGAKANVIPALPTYKFLACETADQANEDDDVKVSIGR